MRHVREQAPALPPDVPLPVRAIVDRAMAKRPAERWPNASAFAQEARRVAGQLGTSAPQPVMAAAAAVGRPLGPPPVGIPAAATRPLATPPARGGYAGHSGELGPMRPPRSGPSAGTLVAIIVAVVLVAVCVGAAIAFLQQGNQANDSARLPETSWNLGGTDSGGQGTP
jgi:serine/threonine-protein kinase